MTLCDAKCGIKDFNNIPLTMIWWSMCPAYEQHKSTSESLGALSFIMFLPYIVQPTRTTFLPNMLIDNSF